MSDPPPSPDAGHRRIPLQRGRAFFYSSDYAAANIADCDCGDQNCVWIRQPDRSWKRFNFSGGTGGR